jgi:guanylate kinase
MTQQAGLNNRTTSLSSSNAKNNASLSSRDAKNNVLLAGKDSDDETEPFPNGEKDETESSNKTDPSNKGEDETSPSSNSEIDAIDTIEELYARLIKPKPVLVIISGPSGVGKDVTLNLMKEQGAPFYFVVTATTRPIRPNEVNGVDYHFVTMGEFAEMITQGELLEYAVVYGDYKGIPKKHLRQALESGQDVIMRIDVQGAATMRKLIPNAVTIFLTAENEDELVRRLNERKTEPPDQLKMRIATARQEMRSVIEFDYMVVNREDQLQDTVNQVLAIIQAEKTRVDWTPVKL